MESYLNDLSEEGKEYLRSKLQEAVRANGSGNYIHTFNILCDLIEELNGCR